jgi:hypothetical protein
MEIHKQQTNVQITDKPEVSSEIERKLDYQAQQAIEYVLLEEFTSQSLLTLYNDTDTTQYSLKMNILLSLYFFYVADLLQE